MDTPTQGRSGLVARLDSLDLMPSSDLHALVWTWIAMQIAGQVLLALLLVTYIFSKRLKAQRHPFVVNFVVTWLLSTFPALLLLYGHQAEGPEPNFDLCLFNASLIAGVPPMEALAFLAVMIQVWTMLRAALENRAQKQNYVVTIALLVAPYIAFITTSLIVGVVGFGDPASVTRSEQKLFCAVGNHHLGVWIWGFSIAVVASTVVIQAWIVVMIYRNWRSVRRSKVSTDLDTHLIFRAAAFAVYEMFMVAISVVSIFVEDSIPPKFLIAAAPIGVFVILASQPDVILSWVVCCRRRDADDSESPMVFVAPEPAAKDPSLSLIEALEDFRFPEGSEPPPRRTNFDATRATFSPRLRGAQGEASSVTSLSSLLSSPSRHSDAPLLQRASSGDSFYSKSESLMMRPAPAPPVLLQPPRAVRVGPTLVRGAPSRSHVSMTRQLGASGSVSGDILEIYDRARGALI